MIMLTIIICFAVLMVVVVGGLCLIEAIASANYNVLPKVAITDYQLKKCLKDIEFERKIAGINHRPCHPVQDHYPYYVFPTPPLYEARPTPLYEAFEKLEKDIRREIDKMTPYIIAEPPTQVDIVRSSILKTADDIIYKKFSKFKSMWGF